MMKAILTGVSGFIGFHVAQQLIDEGWQIMGIDNMNDYYDPRLKKARLAILQKNCHFHFVQADIADAGQLKDVLTKAGKVDIIIHLAAQAGVRYSLENPFSYVHANVSGQVAIFEQATKMLQNIPVVYASSSAVYGGNKKVPFCESDRVDSPLSVYGASKRMAELLAHSYRHIYGLRSTGLRFFTVYGPWGRPDMAPWLFTDAILHKKPIKLFNYGAMMRDFTYIDDIVAGVIAASKRIIQTNCSIEPFYNLGNNQPVKLHDFVSIIEKWTGVEAMKQLEKIPAADVVATYADISLANRDLQFVPQISLNEGLSKFISWFKAYHQME